MNEELYALLEPVDLAKSHCPQFGDSGFGTSSTVQPQEFLQGALPPMIGQSFLQAGSSPPNIDGMASAAIWANCQVGDNSSDLPTCSSHSAFSIVLFISSQLGGVSCTGIGGPPMLEVPAPCALGPNFDLLAPLLQSSLPFFGVTFVLAILEFK